MSWIKNSKSNNEYERKIAADETWSNGRLLRTFEVTNPNMCQSLSKKPVWKNEYESFSDKFGLKTADEMVFLSQIYRKQKLIFELYFFLILVNVLFTIKILRDLKQFFFVFIISNILKLLLIILLYKLYQTHICNMSIIYAWRTWQL